MIQAANIGYPSGDFFLDKMGWVCFVKWLEGTLNLPESHSTSVSPQIISKCVLGFGLSVDVTSQPCKVRKQINVESSYPKTRKLAELISALILRWPALYTTFHCQYDLNQSPCPGKNDGFGLLVPTGEKFRGFLDGLESLFWPKMLSGGLR